MGQYQKNDALKNLAKDKLEGKYMGAIGILLLADLLSWAVRLSINSTGRSSMNHIYALTASGAAATAISFLFDALLLSADILLGVTEAGITLYFLNLASGQTASVQDLFYGFRTDSKKYLAISAAMTVTQAVCLWPGEYLGQNYFTARDPKWLLYALGATAVGLCVYVPIMLGISMSFYLALDFPQHSGKETLLLCWRRMKGHRKRLFFLELGFLPLMLLCVLSFGIGFLWLHPYMRMVYTCFFLDWMNPEQSQE